MNKDIKHCRLTVAFAVAALFTVQPVAADTIQLNSSWAGSGTVPIDFAKTNWHHGSTVNGLHETGGAGGFLTNDLTTGIGGAPAQSWLNGSGIDSTSDYRANIRTVQTSGHGYARDVVVFAPVPEPETYAMMLAGLGLLGFSARRRRDR